MPFNISPESNESGLFLDKSAQSRCQRQQNQYIIIVKYIAKTLMIFLHNVLNRLSEKYLIIALLV